jgi:hypothetical protein
MPDDQELSEGGSPIYRHEAVEREELSYAPTNEARRKALEAHLDAHLGSNAGVWHELISDVVHIDILVYPPTDERNFFVLVTMGMSDLPMNAPPEMAAFQYAELMLCLPANWPMTQEAFEDENNFWPIHWLKRLARLPHEYNSWLSYGHTIPNGDPAEPFAPNTKLSGVVLLPPTQFGDEFDTVKLEGDEVMHLWAIIPLYDAEMDLKLKKGVEALFDGFDQHDVSELLNPQRPNTVLPNKKPGFLGSLFKR